MFGRKNNKSEFERVLKTFFDVKTSSQEHDCDCDELRIKERIIIFIRCFPHQSLRYKTVWIIRILCWLVLFGVAIFGNILRAKKYFGL